MTRRSFHLASFGLMLAPLALGLAACGDKKDAPAPTSGDAIAKIAPPAGKAWTEVVEQTPEGGYRMGNPQAPIKLVEYGSLSCPHCAKFAQDSESELANDFVASGRVSYEFRSFAIHPQDVPLTLLARCGTTDTFFPLVEQIYLNFDAMNAPLADKAVQDRAQAATALPAAQRLKAISEALGYTQFFAQRGLPEAQANACLTDVAKAKEIADHAAKYGADGISSTPTLIINGKQADTPEWENIKADLMAAGAR